VTSSFELLCLSGSLRAGSSNAAVLTTALTLLPEGVTGHQYEGLAELPHFNPDDDREPRHPAVDDLRRRIATAQAILVCTPEYAGALPGSFKNLLDWTVGGVETGGKPVAWINCSPGATRAAGAHESLGRVLRYTDATVIDAACAHLPLTRDAIGSDGVITDPELRAGIRTAVATLVTEARRLAAEAEL
jgi:NAD(P)H-dependent FMN reductase